MVTAVSLGLLIVKLQSYEPDLVLQIYEIIIKYIKDYVNDNIPFGYNYHNEYLWHNAQTLKSWEYLDYINNVIDNLDYDDVIKYKEIYQDILNKSKKLIIYKNCSVHLIYLTDLIWSYQFNNNFMLDENYYNNYLNYSINTELLDNLLFVNLQTTKKEKNENN